LDGLTFYVRLIIIVCFKD